MGGAWYANAFTPWSTATRTSLGAATSINVAEYARGELLIRVPSWSGASPKLRVDWQASGDGVTWYTTTRGVTLVTGATSLGLVITALGVYGRPNAGYISTSLNFKLQATLIGHGQW